MKGGSGSGRARRVAALVAAVCLVTPALVLASAAPSGATPTYGTQQTLIGPALMPFGVAVDSSGDVFVTSTTYGSARVLELANGASTQTVLPFSGLEGPSGVAVDSSGDVFVADTDHNRVLELAYGASTQTVLPFSGLFDPYGLAVDSSGDVFVADEANNRVLELANGSSTQTVLPFSGLNDPTGVAVDSSGDVFVADLANNRVLELANGSSTQTVLPFSGLGSPFGVAVDSSGDVFVTGSFATHEQVLELANGSSTQTVLPFSGLSSPQGVAVDSSGDVFVADANNDQVLELAHGASTQTVLPFSAGIGSPFGVAVDSSGDVFVTGGPWVLELANGSSTPSVLPFFACATDVAVDSSGDVFVTDACNNRVLELANGSSTPTVLPFSGLNNPYGVAVDSSGDVFVADSRNNRVLELADGSSTQTILPFSGLSLPTGVAVDSSGDVFVADSGNNRVLELANGASTQTVLPFSGLSQPWGVAVDSSGDVFVADSGNNRVLELANGASTQTVLPFSGLNGPTGVAVDSSGDVFVADSGNNRVLELPVTAALPVPPDDVTAPSPTLQPALTWSAVEGAVSYNVYRDGTLIGSTTVPSYTDTTATEGTYSYQVTTVNSVGESEPSDAVMVTVGTAPSITSGAAASTPMLEPFSFAITTTGDPTPSLSETGTLPSGISFTDNGDGTATLAGMVAAGSAGQYPITITASNGLGAPATQSFVLTVTTASTAPAITSSDEDTGTFGEPFSFEVTTTGYPAPKITKSGALPSGVTFTDNGDGTATIAGTPTASAIGVYTLTLKAKSSAGEATQTLTLTITKAPVIKPVPTKTAAVGTPFSMTVTSSGYYTPSLTESGALPAGLGFTDNGDGTATIAGTPLAGSGGAYSITVSASNQLGTTSLTFTLKVHEAPTITSPSSAAASVGVPFSFEVTATGFPSPHLSKIGKLPGGLTFSASTGTISGTPTSKAAGTYYITFAAKNSSGEVTQTFVLTVT